MLLNHLETSNWIPTGLTSSSTLNCPTQTLSSPRNLLRVHCFDQFDCISISHVNASRSLLITFSHRRTTRRASTHVDQLPQPKTQKNSNRVPSTCFGRYKLFGLSPTTARPRPSSFRPTRSRHFCNTKIHFDYRRCTACNITAESIHGYVHPVKINEHITLHGIRELTRNIRDHRFGSIYTTWAEGEEKTTDAN